MEVEFGMPVVDKDNKAIGDVGKIIIDSWTGKPRKYIVRQEVEGTDTLFMIAPAQIAEVAGGQVKLNVSAADLESA